MKEWIIGRNPVYECLRAERRHFFQLLIADKAKVQARLEEITQIAGQQHVQIDRVDKSQLDRIDRNHQGVALQVSGYPYAALEDIFQYAENCDEPLFMLMLDQVQDPQNFGTLIRSAEVFGLHGIIIPPRRAVGITPAVVNASSGASEHLRIAQANIAQTAEELKERNSWVVGLDMDSRSEPLDRVNLTGGLAFVVGSEGSGLRRLVAEKCDLIAHIPMKGTLDSLNTAVAGSIALYAAFLQRRIIKKA